MNYRSRRRLDVGLLALAGIVVGGVGAGAAAAGDTERIDVYWTGAELTDEQAQIIEVIDYDFGPQQRHGIFRDIDELDPTAPIDVFSPTAPDQFVVEATFGAERIRIGDPDRTISGRHRYRIEYPLDVEVVAAPGARMAWDAVGDRWQVGMGSVEVHLVAATEFTDLLCSKGQAGTWGGCTLDQPRPGHLTAVIDGLRSGEGVTISATPSAALAAAPALPTPPAGRADDPGTGVLAPAATALIAAIGAGAAASRLLRRQGRELVWAGGAADAAYGPQFGQDMPTRLVDHSELEQLASTEFTPPRGLTAWQGGVLHREGVDGDHQVAWLLERAIAGEVRIDGAQDEDGEIGDGAVTLVRQQAASDARDEEVLDQLFGQRRTVTLDGYDKQFAAGWNALGKRLGDWQDHSPLWDPAGDDRRRRSLGLGAVAALLGLVMLVISAVLANRAGLVWLVGVAIGAATGGIGLAMLVRSWELRVRTPAGSGLWILTESFRRFVERSEATHVEEAARQGRLREYTAWATALGEAGHWADAVGEADVDPGIEPTGLYLAGLAPHLGSATTSAATAPSSSGGGGGGSVGGGGGGGGGGSW